MKPQIKFLNFVPSEREFAEIRAMIDRAYELIPSDGDLVTKIIRQGTDIVVDMAINSQKLTYRCWAKTRSAYSAVDTALEQIKTSIYAWQGRKGRSIRSVT